MSAQQKAGKAALAGDELKSAIKRQVEFYFSRNNLANDAFLVSQMSSQMFVPVDVILKFSKIQELTDSAALLVEAVADSTVCSLNEAKDAIKPNIKSERTTIILREIPSATPPAEVEAIFADCGHEVASVRSDVGDTWFVTMASEQDAVQTLLELRSKTFRGAAIKARLKSENLLKSFYPTQPAENTITPAIGTPYGGRGYFGNGGGGYYDVPNAYGVQYMNGRGQHPHHHGQHYGGHQQAPSSSRGGGRLGGSFRGNRSGNNASANANANAAPAVKEVRGKGGNSAEGRPNARKSKSEKRAAKANASSGDKKEQQQQPAASHGPHAHGKKGDRQPILSAANFPPLPTVAPGDKPAAAAVIAHSYAHEDIMEIVKNMDEDDCKLPEGKMDFAGHPAALTPVAHPDLLRNQRTYSIEQAREAMRQGRPIRSDSVGSIDYESLMYGEDYTKEAREQRQQQQAAAPAASSAPSASSQPRPAAASTTTTTTSTTTSMTKVVGYAAAVIHGTPAPAPVLEPKKKQPAKAAATPSTGPSTASSKTKEDKKSAKKPAAKAPEAKPAADESLPKAGAWGGRNFLDVVKSEPPAAPAKVETKKPADKTESK